MAAQVTSVSGTSCNAALTLSPAITSAPARGSVKRVALADVAGRFRYKVGTRPSALSRYGLSIYDNQRLGRYADTTHRIRTIEV